MLKCGVWMAVALIVAVSVSGRGAVASCPSDVDGSGAVGLADLIAVLDGWGPCPACPADLDDSGVVDLADLIQILADWGPCPATELKLSARPLLQSPFATRVNAQPRGAELAVVIDRVELGGVDRLCDLYVVADRTAAEWAADTLLVDVRGVPQAIELAAAPGPAHVTSVTGAAGLTGGRARSLGEGFDLICDCNRNGQLDGADFIDGGNDAPGVLIVDDLTAPGPYAVVQLDREADAGLVPEGFTAQRIWYPASIAELGELPLVTISHGNGHQYDWYDWLGQHLASRGCVVLSHDNQTMQGIETASATTVLHTDAFFEELPLIDSGALIDRVDARRLIWIGHSRGGEGVVRGLTRVRTGDLTPTHFTADDLVLLSSIAPTNALGQGFCEPGNTPYHLIWGAADGDVGGYGEITWSFTLYERAQGWKHSTYIHGADHNDFNCCGYNDFQGPSGTAIGRVAAQNIAKAEYSILLARYLEGETAAAELLWRQDDAGVWPGVDADVILVRDQHEPAAASGYVIDDYETMPSAATSSSGGAVTGTMFNVFEDAGVDLLFGYLWTSLDPMNGMSRLGAGDTGRAVVFEWHNPLHHWQEHAVTEAFADVSEFQALSFRAAQQSHHPRTVSALEDLTFHVTLRDLNGVTATLDLAAYGGGIEELYQRSGGWQNELETVRLPLADFVSLVPELDLQALAAVRFDFGTDVGGPDGRLILDDLRFVPAPGAVLTELPFAAPVRHGVVRQLEWPPPVLATIHAATRHPDGRWSLEISGADALLRPRAGRERILMTGSSLVERGFYDAERGRLQVVVPAGTDFDPARDPVFFGPLGFPEQMTPADFRRVATPGATAG